MQCTTKTHLYALLSFVLVVAFSSLGWPQEATVKVQIKDLQAKREKILTEAYDLAWQQLRASRIETQTLRDVLSKLFAARHELAETQDQRIKVIEEELTEATKMLEYSQERVAASRGTTLEVQRSQAYLLDCQIRLITAKASE